METFSSFALHAFWLLAMFLVLRLLWDVMRAVTKRTRRTEASGSEERGRQLTVAQLLIRALYHTAAWLEDLAIGMDRGYLSYRIERRMNEIEPENERFGAPAPEVNETMPAAEAVR